MALGLEKSQVIRAVAVDSVSFAPILPQRAINFAMQRDFPAFPGPSPTVGTAGRAAITFM